MEQENIDRLSFKNIGKFMIPNFHSDDIAIYTDIKFFTTDRKRFVKNKMLILIACKSGCMSMDINADTRTINRNELLVVFPNDVISNCMISPDFKCGAICMSERGILKQSSVSDLWDWAVKIVQNPIIKVDESQIRLFRMYSELFTTKLAKKQTHSKVSYYTESIHSIVKAMLYDLLSFSGSDERDSVDIGFIRQREVQFKRFVKLLSDCDVKPRSVSWYADKMCLSPKRLSQICKQVSDRTALDWINEYVCKDISQWLKNSDKSIKEIAYLLNFPNISFFGKYCRKHFGVSPTIYRLQLRNQP